jgi:PKD repeat protein
MADRISTLSNGYSTGMLSVFPQALDDFDSLYQASNNTKMPLKQSLTFTANRIILEDTSMFPPSGIVRVGPENGVPSEYEMIYYGSKTPNTLENLVRGFAGSKQSKWSMNENFVTNSVVAEHHNAIKDALLNMQANCGIKDFPEAASLNGILKTQEVRFLAPKPLFRAFPIKGPPSLNVRFQNFSTGHIVRYLWDFGDGGTSLEKSPTHVYLNEGIYTVKLNIITSTGAQGVATKVGYIEVNSDEALPYFYVDSIDNPYSQEYATANSVAPKEFVFVDQSDGDIVQRNWIFGDGTTYTELDPDKHQITHIYAKAGEYIVTQLIQFANGRIKRVELGEPLVVL